MGNKVKRDPLLDKGFTDAELVEINKIENPRSKADLLAEHAASLLLRFQDNIESLMDVALSGEAPTPQEIARIVMKLHQTNYLYRTIIVEPLEKRAGKLSKDKAKNPLKSGLTAEDVERERAKLWREGGGKHVSQERLAERLGISRPTLVKLTRNG